jgi:hypothetical protein
LGRREYYLSVGEKKTGDRFRGTKEIVIVNCTKAEVKDMQCWHSACRGRNT